MWSCTTYSSYKDCKNRCLFLNLCAHYLSSYHNSDESPGGIKGLDYKYVNLNSRAQISALCPNDFKKPKSNVKTNLCLMSKYELVFYYPLCCTVQSQVGRSMD